MIGETGEILSHNMYAYCLNNPVMMVDPSGYMPSWMKVTLVAVAVVAVVVAAVILAPVVVAAVSAAVSTIAVSGAGGAIVAGGVAAGGVITAGGAATAIGTLGLAYLSASIAATDGAVIDDAIDAVKELDMPDKATCFAAERNFDDPEGGIYILELLTKQQAISRIRSGQDIYTPNAIDAFAIAFEAGGGIPTLHPAHQFNKWGKYMPKNKTHYHFGEHSLSHIFFG
jgi:hypothetical protein